jgi:hypothetical protein
MAAQSGNTATFTWNASAVGDLVSIGDVTIEGAQIDVSTLGANAYREFIGGKYQASFTVEVFWNKTAHDGFMGDLLARTSRAFVIDFGDGSVSGNAIPTSAAVSASIDDAVRCSIACQVTGAVTIAA